MLGVMRTPMSHDISGSGVFTLLEMCVAWAANHSQSCITEPQGTQRQEGTASKQGFEALGTQLDDFKQQSA